MFDDVVSPERIVASVATDAEVELLSFAADWTVVDAVATALRQHVRGGVCVLPSGRLVDREAMALRHVLPDWSDRLAALDVGGRSVRGWLAEAGGPDVFWYGAIAERNPLKAPEFGLVAQVRALDAQFGAAPYTDCSISVASPLARRAFEAVSVARGVPTRIVRSRVSHLRAGGVRALVEYPGRAPATVVAALAFVRLLVWRLLARGLTLRPDPAERRKRPVLFLTYFPYVDREAASCGQFRNRYAEPLQRLLEEAGRPVWWVAMFVFMDGWNFRAAAALARRLARRHTIALLDAYLTPRVLWRVLRRWSAVRRRAIWLDRRLGSDVAEGLLPRAAWTVARQLWLRSYVGVDSLRGLCQYELFLKVLADARGADTAVYFAEMQIWEQAFNAAVRDAGTGMRTIGYQHSSIGLNYYPFRRSRGEMERSGSATDFPMPGVLAVSGELQCRLFGQSRYRALTVVEAIRYLDIASTIPRGPRPVGGSPTLLVAGSADLRETVGLVSLVARAYPLTDGLRVRFKGHPSLDVADVLARLNLSLEQTRYEIWSGSLADALAEADLVLVGNSTAGIEALAFGCEVLVLTLAASPSLTPLAGHEEFYRPVYAPEDLRTAVEEFRTSGPHRTFEEKRAFVRAYWSIDPSLSRWRTLLDPELHRESGAWSDQPQPEVATR